MYSTSIYVTHSLPIAVRSGCASACYLLRVGPVGKGRDNGLGELDVVAELIRSRQPQDVVVRLQILGGAIQFLRGQQIKVHLVTVMVTVKSRTNPVRHRERGVQRVRFDLGDPHSLDRTAVQRRVAVEERLQSARAGRNDFLEDLIEDG